MRGGEYIINASNLSEKEKGYLFGLFEGDGYSLHNKEDRHYSVEFYLNSKTNLEIISFLSSIIRKLSLNPIKRKDKRFSCIRIRINSKQFFNFINTDYRQLLENYEFSLGFFSGFLDAEGYVDKDKRILNIVNTDYEIMNNLSNILKKNKISHKLSIKAKSQKDKKTIYILRISVKFKNLPHISIKAGKL